jgi:MYXO-CTERM domain-containing protein
MALDGNAAANRISGIGGTYTPTSQIANGASFYLRWADPDDGGSDNAVAIDSLSILFSLVPEPSTWLAGALALGAIGFMQRRRLCNTLKR